MRIVFCHNYYRIPGGEDRVFEAETQMMRDHGHDVHLYALHNRDINEKHKLRTAKNVVWNGDVYQELNQLANQIKPDVVHFTNTFPVISPAAYWAFQNAGVPVIQSLHNFRLICPGSLLLRNGKFCDKCVTKKIAWPSMVHRCYRGSVSASAISTINNTFHKAIRTWDTKIDRYIALSRFSKKQFMRGGISAKKLIVKPNFVLDPPSVNTAKSDFVVFVGRLSHEKGIGNLLDAWKLAQRKFKLLVIGSGPLSGLVRKAEKESGGMIELMGQLPHSVVMNIVADACLAVVPSISVETFGRSVIEAYAVATPVVGFDIGSIAENVQHGKTGWLVEPGNSKALSREIELALADPKLLAEIGRNGRTFFENHFTAEKNYQATMAIYEELVAAKRQPKWFVAKTYSNDEASEQIDSDKVKMARHLSGDKDSATDSNLTTWPQKVSLFGLNVSETDYERSVLAIKQAAKNREPASISCHAAHAVVTFTDRSDWTELLNRFEMITPDGQPVRWAMNLMHNSNLSDRVYGPELMLRVCEMAAQERLSIFLYGGSPNTLEMLQQNISTRFPDLKIAGAISPPFRELTESENTEIVEQINSSKAHLLFVGLGCPKQDLFVARNRQQFKPVQICVGAAFDFHAGVKRMAPRWMQRYGLEWLFRMASEPKRLFKRYLVTNTVFVYRVAKQIFQKYTS